MGLIYAALSSFSTTLSDQYLEYFICDALPSEVLAAKGQKKNNKGGSNKGSDNVISSGSKIVVNEGQAMIMVDNGIITEIATTPGVYTYDSAASPSFFSSSFGAGIKNTFKETWERMKFGGVIAKDQRIYYFNTKEIRANKFGTKNPVPFRVAYNDPGDIGRPFTIGVKCFGTYTYKIYDPSLFFANVCGNFEGQFFKRTDDDLDEQLRSEFLSKLQPGFGNLSNSIRYDELPMKVDELTQAMQKALVDLWRNRRGIDVDLVNIDSVTISPEDEAKIKKYEDLSWNRDAANAAATMVTAQAEAMTNAASNANGAAMGFYGMGMAQQAGGLNANTLFQMAADQKAAAAGGAAPAAPVAAAAPAGSWTCVCGAVNTGKFCENCGKPKATADGWTCECGAVNKGRFCSECGKAKPAGAPLYKCDKCGWEPADPFNPPKFCAECGDPFTDDDIVS